MEASSEAMKEIHEIEKKISELLRTAGEAFGVLLEEDSIDLFEQRAKEYFSTLETRSLSDPLEGVFANRGEIFFLLLLSFPFLCFSSSSSSSCSTIIIFFLQEIQTRLRLQFKFANVPSASYKANNFDKEKEFEVTAMAVNHVVDQLDDVIKETERELAQDA